MIQTTLAHNPGLPSWGYQLQGVEVSEIAESPFNLLVIDYSLDGSDESAWSNEQITEMKNGDKTLLSYISIGEAEDYRYYWDNDWLITPPQWLDDENPDWEGNFKVKYWMESWQNIIFGYLDKIISQGFDGVYLDIIDAYYFYETNGRNTAENEMIDWVIKIADYSRTQNSEFLIFPQNGEELLENNTYRSIISGIGIEDLYYVSENEKNTESDITERESYLELAVNDEKTVLTVDYIKDSAKQDEVYKRSTGNGFIPYFTTRDLDTLTIPDFLKDPNSKSANFLSIIEVMLVLTVPTAIKYKSKRKKSK